MLRFTLIAACVVAGCEYSYPGDVPLDADPQVDADTQIDANIDGTSVDAMPGMWSAPVPLAINTEEASESGANASPNGLELYFEAPQSTGSFVPSDIFYVTRTATSFDWGQTRTAVGALNSAQAEGAPSISADGLELHFGRVTDIYVSKRATLGSAWGAPMTTGLAGFSPDILADGLTMYYRASGATCPVYLCRMRVTRATTASAWGNPVLESINDAGTYQRVDISGDGLRALLSAPFSASVAKVAIVTRPTRNDPWGVATPITELSLYTAIISAAWSWDERDMYLVFNTGANDLYVSHLQ